MAEAVPGNDDDVDEKAVADTGNGKGEGIIWEMRGLFIPVLSTQSGNGERVGKGEEAHPGNEEVEHRSEMAVADTGSCKGGGLIWEILAYSD